MAIKGFNVKEWDLYAMGSRHTTGKEAHITIGCIDDDGKDVLVSCQFMSSGKEAANVVSSPVNGTPHYRVSFPISSYGIVQGILDGPKPVRIEWTEMRDTMPNVIIGTVPNDTDSRTSVGFSQEGQRQ